MAWYWQQYAPEPADRRHPYASPLHAQPTGLPSTILVTAGFDPLCTEGTAYAKALAAAGVTTVHRHYPGAIQRFMTIPGIGTDSRGRDQAWADTSDLPSRSPR